MKGTGDERAQGIGMGSGMPGPGLSAAGPARPGPGRPCLEVRLAESEDERRQAQALRFDVFHAEMGAVPDAAARASRRDADRFDPACDHLLVLDHGATPRPSGARRPEVVGTARLLRGAVARARTGFYGEASFDLAPLLARHPEIEFLELGRACVHPAYRARRTVELLWQGIWDYARAHGIGALFGCASLPGTDLVRLAPALSFLHHRAAAPPEWRVRARPDRRAPLDLLPADVVAGRDAWTALPPLVKGYLRVGAGFGDGVVLDPSFGTTDVFVTLPVRSIPDRYLARFGPVRTSFPAAAEIAARPSR